MPREAKTVQEARLLRGVAAPEARPRFVSILTDIPAISQRSCYGGGMPADTKAPPTVSLYFRTSAKVREDVGQFGGERSLTLSSALAALVERGLEAVANEESIHELEAKAQRLGKEVAVLRERDRGWQTAFNSLQGQLKTLRVGRCPNCDEQVTAYDQLLARKCPACNQPLEQVVVEKAEEFPPALAALVGAVGGLLFGIASASQGVNAGT